MAKFQFGSGLLVGAVFLGAIGCTDKCFLCKGEKSPEWKGTAKKEMSSRPPVGWPPESTGSTTVMESQNKTIAPVVATVATKPSEPSGPSPYSAGGAVQQAVAFTGQKDQGGAQIINAQRIETVPYTKPSPAPQPFAPASNPDPKRLPILPESGSAQQSFDSSTAPLPTNNSLTVPPPPPGSPLGGATPLGIPTPPSSAPNR